MPIVEANGKEFEFPEGTTQAQMGEAVDSYFAQQQPVGFFDRVAEMFTGSERATPQTKDLPEIVGSGILSDQDPIKVAAVSPAIMTATNPNEIVSIVTSTFPDIGVTYNQDGQGNTIPLLVNNNTGQATIINRPGFSSMDLLQTTAIGSALFPATRATSVLGAAAGAGATSAAIQGAQELSGGEFNPEEVAIDAVLGGGGKALENIAGTSARILQGNSDNAIVKAGADSGVPVMTSDLFQPTTFVGKTGQKVGERIPLIGTGGKRVVQQESREAAVDNIIQNYGDFSYDAIVSSLKSKSGRVKQAAGNVLESVQNKIGGVSTSKTQQAIQDVTDALSDPAVMRSSKALEDLDELMAALNSPQTFTSLKENRTAFREVLNSVDVVGRSQLPSRAKAQLSKVAAAMSDDLDAAAKTNLSAREYGQWKRANAVYAKEAQLLTQTKLKNVLDAGDVTPEAVEGMLFSQKASDLNRLYESLTVTGRSNARAAIITRMADNLRRRATGITPSGFSTQMKSHRKQIDAFFKGDEKRALDGFGKLLDATRRAQEAGVSTPTGQELVGLATGAGLIADPIVTGSLASTAGGLAQAYEHPLVRGALLRLASVPRGSTRFETALREAQSAWTLVAQASADQVQQQDATPQ